MSGPQLPLDLSGRWRARVADEGLRRVFAEPGHEDGDWVVIAVPGHWRSVADFASQDGPVLYRCPFELAPRSAGDGSGLRSWLTFDGIFYQGDVWLDGAYLGDTEGYFFPHTFEITAARADRGEHLLAVEVSCSRESDRTAKRNITGVFQHWDCLDPDWNPGGIWRAVRVEETGPVRIERLRALCAEADSRRAVVTLRAVLDAAEPTTVTVRTGVGDLTEHREQHVLTAGQNEVEWRVTVQDPPLWWPHLLGDQPLHDLVVEVLTDDDRPSHRITRRLGLRSMRMKRWIMTVNGERLFIKGTNQGPTRMALADATADELERDVLLAKDAGLDLLRVHAHVSRPELYDAADRHGMLLWQDMPLQWGYARGIRKQAIRQAREAVDLLGHHPSVAVWCGHNEPLAIDTDPGTSEVSPLRFLALQELPTWNKTILDHSVKRALERHDRTRPVIAHSGVLPHPGSGGTDTHIYFGWYHGEERDFPTFCAAVPRMARFVTEFGAQSVPHTAGFMEPHRWPDLDWARLARTHALQKPPFDRYVAPADHESFESWRDATQAYQADIVRFHIETLRRLKYRPTGGFCQFSFADGHPAVTWAVLDHERVPKVAYAALAAACAPVIVVADRPAPSYAAGDALALDVHVVSDLRHPVAGVVTATLTWSTGSHEWRWSGEVGADACARVGTLQAVVPAARGAMRLDLRFDGPAGEVTNSYETVIRE